jgi:hypothetical protein
MDLKLPVRVWACLYRCDVACEPPGLKGSEISFITTAVTEPSRMFRERGILKANGFGLGVLAADLESGWPDISWPTIPASAHHQNQKTENS